MIPQFFVAIKCELNKLSFFLKSHVLCFSGFLFLSLYVSYVLPMPSHHAYGLAEEHTATIFVCMCEEDLYTPGISIWNGLHAMQEMECDCQQKNSTFFIHIQAAALSTQVSTGNI